MNEDTFVRELERRADQVRPAPLSFDTVRGRAVRIRRRRRVGAGVVVAAAVAVAAVVPTMLGGDRPRTAPDPAPPTAPGASVLHDGTLTFPDGGTVELDLDNADVGQVGLLTDGRIVVAMTDPPVIRVYAADGTTEAEYETQSNAITMSAADDAVAWIGADFGIRVLASGVPAPVAMDGVPMPGESHGSIDAVLDDEHVLVGDWQTTQYVVTPEGRERLRTSEPLRVTDVSPDGARWAVQYADAADLQFGCVGLYDPAAAAMVARSCQTSGLRFSPDGRHLLGGYMDNNMGGETAMYDRQLNEVGAFAREGGTTVISRAAWIDDDHLLVAVTDWEVPRWSLVRVALDGTAEEVVPAAPGRNPEMVAEFVFSE